ncbi:MAG: cell division protein FtsZ [Candidatus Rehaiarchaeum fermentans]|nr:cell division protein FtsZ [Candidatus Rehaiarchaeum fermentans]
MENEFVVEEALKTNGAPGVAGQARIKIIGAGGAGCNIVSYIYKKGIVGVETIIANTDEVQLKARSAHQRLLLGKEVTRGLGAGGDWRIGKRAAEESASEIKNLLKGSDLTFLITGLGGGTGTGAAPVIAKVSKELGAITIAVVTTPFTWEGGSRLETAEIGLKELRNYADTVILIDNQRLVKLAGNAGADQAYALANDIIYNMISGIVNILLDVNATIHRDFADIRAIMNKGGVAMIGVGESSSSEDRAGEAIRKALSNPLLEVNYKGAKGALIHIHGGTDLGIQEVEKIMQYVSQFLDLNASIVPGVTTDPNMNGKIRVTAIIVGVNSPYIVGKEESTAAGTVSKALQNELGIKML